MEYLNPPEVHADIFAPRPDAPMHKGPGHWLSAEAWRRPGGTEQVQQGLDTAYWFGTLMSDQTGLLNRLFSILWHGGMMWRSKPSDRAWRPWVDTQYPVASCLAHGGRLLIEFPGHLPVWDWLWGVNNRKISRHAATHGILYYVDKGRLAERVGDFAWKHTFEIKTSPFRPFQDKGQGGHFGVNLAGGGAGLVSPYTGNPIEADGRHGHLYMYYVRRRGFGSILVGAEDSAPLDCITRDWGPTAGIATVNLLTVPLTFADVLTGGGTARQPLAPGLRLALPQGQTGAFHAFGVSGDYSFTGSSKFKKLGRNAKTAPGWKFWSKSKPAGESFGRVPTGNDCIFVSPSYWVWEGLLENRLTFDIMDIGKYPAPPRWRIDPAGEGIANIYDERSPNWPARAPRIG